MWQEILISLVFNTIYSIQYNTNDKNPLKNWFDQVKSPTFTCPSIKNEETRNMKNDKTPPLIKVVDCNELGAIYQYDYRLPGGKKPKKGQFNGYGILIFADVANDNSGKLYGVRNRKCVKVSNRDLQSISGYFEHDILMGDVSMTFHDETFAKGFIHNGILVGLVRYFTTEGHLINITDISMTTNKEHLLLSVIENDKEMEHKNYIMDFVNNTEKETGYIRKLVTTSNMEEIYDCLQIDNKFYVNCFEIDFDNNIHINGCQIEYANRPSSWIGKTNLLLDPYLRSDKKIQTEIEKFCITNSDSTIQKTLVHWTFAVGDRHLFWNYFATEVDQIDANNPQIDIMIHYVKNLPQFQYTRATIETYSGLKLFEGDMVNGHLTGQVDQDMINHPGWRTRLIIQIEKNIQMRRTSLNVGMTENITGLTNTIKISLRVTLKNGKLDGLVQIYGILSRNVVGHCSDIITPGLAFVGHFENGIPVGPVWRQLVGGSWLYGELDENFEFTGKDVAFIHQDLELAMIGQFEKGLMVNGQEAEVIGEHCNENGIKVLKFSQPSGPIYHYLPATNITFGDQPLLRDPLAKKYLYLKNSNDLIADASSKECQGTFATRDVPVNTVFVQYGGMLYDEYQTEILKMNVARVRKENNWGKDDPRAAYLWMYRHNLGQCGYKIDIPPAFKSTSTFQGTLGHKVNHKFNPNSVYIHYDTPRFGIILAVKTLRKIMKDQEYFADYGYQFHNGPRWYRRLFRHYAKENSNLNSIHAQNILARLEALNNEEKNEANYLTDTSNTAL